MEFEVKAPILGFEEIKRMKLEKIDDLFMTLKNCDGEDGAPSFTLVNPYLLREFAFEIPMAMKLLLELQDNTNLLVLNIMIVHDPIESSTINFLAPVLFNFDNQSMGQVVLDSSRYPDYGLTEMISNFIVQNEEAPDA